MVIIGIIWKLLNRIINLLMKLLVSGILSVVIVKNSDSVGSYFILFYRLFIMCMLWVWICL